jgi:preprotein translocase subunit SecY
VILLIILMVIVTFAFVVFMERSLRKIHIQYPRRQVGMKVYDGGSSHLPIKVNPAGVMPAIFASALLLLPTTIATFSQTTTGPLMATLLAYLGRGQPLYLLFFIGMIVFFTYFYTHEVAFKTEDVAENLKNQNGFIPASGRASGPRTTSTTWSTASWCWLGYLARRCPARDPALQLAVPFYFGGTSVLIIVSVGMDTIQQSSRIAAHQYEGLIEVASAAAASARAPHGGPRALSEGEPRAARSGHGTLPGRVRRLLSGARTS